ncbi:MAG: glycosyl hydrolase-related protein [Candidatus Aminicenantes bacterium]|nr:glycosyl hydrolase-related protein [Candidatus Aminicenantes bacterium]
MRVRRTIIAALLAAASITVGTLSYAAGQASSAPGPPRLEKPRDYTAHLVGHAHIDLAWLWRWEETVRDIAVQTFRGTLARMRRMPGLTFAQSQAAVYEAVEKTDPELFAEIRSRVREGTWLPVGGMWAEPDLNMPDGEALARQLLYGKRYFLEKFGVDVKVGWNPDSFGHNAQLPQLLTRAGITSYVFERCAPERTPFFWWEGKDASRVLAHVPVGWYLVSLQDGLSRLLAEPSGQTPVKDFLILYGEGDHGGGPRDSDLQAIERIKKDKSEPKLILARPEDFFRRVAAAWREIPVVKRELNFTFPACYTTQAAIKRNNRLAESLLLTAEKFSALAVQAGYRDYYPERDLDEAWKTVLRNQFHDILDGSSIGPVYEEAARTYRDVFERGRRALDFSLETIVNAIDTRGEGTPLVVFNPLFWPRTDAVETEVAVAEKPAAIRLLAADGAEVPVQVLERKEAGDKTTFRIIFTAADVPSFGYRIFRAVGADVAAGPGTAVVVEGNRLENEFFRVVFDPQTGWLRSVFDKRNGRDVLTGPGNVLEAIVDTPESMSAWDLGLKETVGRVGESGARVEVVEAGPVRAVVRATAPFRRSVFRQEVILQAGVARVDFRLALDWQERNLMIKAAFPVALHGGRAEFEIPFGSVTRPADGTEVPALRWIDLTDEAGDYGVSLLNDSKYGFDIMDNRLRMSVVHGATSPDPEADRGRHELAYALYAHRGDWAAGETLRRGAEFNNPLLARKAMVHGGTLPAATSFVSVAPDNVVLSALKKESGYYDRALIVRLYEAHGLAGEATVRFPWPVEFRETDLIERPLARGAQGQGRDFAVDLKPFEIRTFRVVKLSGR